MKSFRYVLLLFSGIMLSLFAALVWGGFRFYNYERSRLAGETESIVKKAADSIQRVNLTLNNMVSLDNDPERGEKNAFAVGMTGNLGKMRIYWEDSDTTHYPEAPDTVINVDKDYLKKNHAIYNPAAVKNLHHFDSAFNALLKQANLAIVYRSHRVSPNDTTRSKYQYTSTPFVINFYDPTVYEVQYSLPYFSILPGLAPYISICLLLLLMVTAAFLFYYRSYRIQAQMSLFKETLFSNITHELKTPLSSLQLIIDNASDNAALSKEYIQFAADEIARMKLLVDKILSFGTMTEEQFELNKELITIDDAIYDAIKIADMQLKQVNGRINYNKGSNITIMGDKMLLTNTIATLLDNAIKYSDVAPVINVTCSLDNNNIVVTIADNGIGIPEGYHKKIFQPFFRVPTGNLHTVKGHGLGLSFAKQVLTLHHGTIQASSNNSNSTTFIIHIPKL